MHEAVICEPIRTPIGRYGGVLRDVPVTQLASHVVETLLARTGAPPESIDDVILGQGYGNGEAPALGRVAALDAGLPVTVPGLQLDRRCGSGLQAVIDAAMRIQTGAAEVVLAGGAESMSQVEFATQGIRWGVRSSEVPLVDRLARARVTAGGGHHPVPGGMLETAENLRREFAIPREEQDELALRSHQRAVAAQVAGRFDDELVPVEVPVKGGTTTIARDEHPRADTSLEKLASLRAIRGDLDPNATVTAGNSSGQNDGAAVCLVTTPERAEALGVRPLARLVSWAVSGCEPHRMGVGPVTSTTTALDRAGLTLADVDLIELNEAFAAQVLAVTHSWGLTETDHERLNVNGSGISLGHPIGATGGRILATLLRELDRREARYGLETMCIGGGQGLAAVFERIAPS